MSTAAAPLLEARALSLRAAGRPLVQGLDWQVWPGQRWCVIGRNAAGKIGRASCRERVSSPV